jgi:hypothetical protein
VICRQDGVRDILMGVAKRMKRQKVRFADGDITHSATLAAVKAATFEHVILLSYSDLPIQEADAKTLITLLHLRNLADAAGVRLSIVSEMMDLRNRALAQIARADDFIVSDKLVSLMMSQLSENKNLEHVFKVLFSSEGSEIYIRPMTDYIKLGSTVDFYTVLEAAAERGRDGHWLSAHEACRRQESRVWCQRESEEVREAHLHRARPDRRARGELMTTRRQWLAGALVGAMGAVGVLAPGTAAAESPDRALKRIRERIGGRLGRPRARFTERQTLGHRRQLALRDGVHLQTTAGAALLWQVDRKAFTLDHALAIKATDILPNSPAVEAKLASGMDAMTIRELCGAVVTQSDNAAANVLLNGIGGPTAFNQFMRTMATRSRISIVTSLR